MADWIPELVGDWHRLCLLGTRQSLLQSRAARWGGAGCGSAWSSSSGASVELEEAERVAEPSSGFSSGLSLTVRVSGNSNLLMQLPQPGLKASCR